MGKRPQLSFFDALLNAWSSPTDDHPQHIPRARRMFLHRLLEPARRWMGSSGVTTR